MMYFVCIDKSYLKKYYLLLHLNHKKEKYAICQFNINNLEWTKYILEECEKNNSPVILGVSESSIAHYEQGITMPGADIILKCAEYFNVNIDYIFGRCSYKSNYINLNSIFCKKSRKLGLC